VQSYKASLTQSWSATPHLSHFQKLSSKSRLLKRRALSGAWLSALQATTSILLRPMVRCEGMHKSKQIKKGAHVSIE
jgi:hypothetical protein